MTPIITDIDGEIVSRTWPLSYSVDEIEPEPTPVIVDVSIWQGDIDAAKLLANAHGLIIRAGSINNVTGVCYEDDQFQNNVNKFSGEIPMGAYWYFRPNHDPILQAKYFADLLDRGTWNIPPTVDVECNPNNDAPDNVARWLSKFTGYLSDVVGWHYPMVYTRGYFWNDNISSITALLFGTMPLWIARYTTYPLPWGNSYDNDKYRPNEWDDWRLWQYSADGNGLGAKFGCESSAIDISRFNGSLSEFYRWCCWKQEPAPEPEPEPCPLCAKMREWMKKCPLIW